MPAKPISTAALRQSIRDARATDAAKRWADSTRRFWREKPVTPPAAEPRR
jgi:hypothetical protein